MENNTNAPVNPAPVPETPVQASSNKGGFWKGFFIGVLAMILLGVAVISVPMFFVVKEVGSGLEEARAKGNVASLKANMSNLRPQAELYYDSNDMTYAGVCRSPMFISGFSSIANQALDQDIVCYDNATAYVVGATYADTTGIKTFCINNTGVSAILSGRASSLITSTNYPCK